MQRFIILQCQSNMRTIIIFTVIISFVLSSCSKSAENNNVLLRIENTGNITFDSVLVINPAGKQVYLNIGSNAKSGYKEFAFIYNYSYIKAYYGNEYALLQPIDYVGETKFTNGKFTYKIFIVSNLTSNNIIVENRKD